MTTYRRGDRTPIEEPALLREAFVPENPVPGRMGIEWEFLPVADDSRLVPFGAPGGVCELFGEMEGGGYRLDMERGIPIGLHTGDGAFVGLEPGAQVEVSTRPFTRLADLFAQLEGHRERLEAGARTRGWRLAPWGLAPHNGPEDNPDVPKERYGLLRDYLQDRGSRGRWMMKLTASVQMSLDFPSEEGLELQMDGLLRVLPYLTGWLANSPVSNGRKGRWKTLRPFIWRRTDRLRCGLPAFFFRPGLISSWQEYALTRPVIFLVRDGAWHTGGNRTFREWLEDPRELGPITMEDWDTHLSTLFTDFRLRSYLEIRTLDAVPLPWLCAAAALCKGLFGDPQRIPSWRDLIPAPSRRTWGRNLYRAAEGGGDWIPIDGPPPRKVGPPLLEQARLGLQALGEDPDALETLSRSIPSGTCPADHWYRSAGGCWRGP